MKKEQSSNSTPKVKYALAEKYDQENREKNQKEVDAHERLKTKESEKLPRPTGWRMLILPFKMKEKSKGGIIFGQETLEKQQVGSTCGLVLAQGPDCYNDKTRYQKARGARQVIGCSLLVMQDQEFKLTGVKYVC